MKSIATIITGTYTGSEATSLTNDQKTTHKTTHHENQPHKRRRLDSEDQSKSPTSASTFPNNQAQVVTIIPLSSSIVQGSTTPNEKNMSDIDCIDDVFLNIMHFFVGARSIDAQSIHSIMQVSKRWSSISTSPEFWRCIPKLKSTPTDTLQTRLLGYAKLGKAKYERSYRVKERATNKIFRLEIHPLKDKYPFEGGHLKRHLREIGLRNDMDQLDEQENVKQHLCLVQDWDVCHGNALNWHEHADYTLKSFMQKHDLRSRRDLVKGIVFQILRGVDSLHRCGLTHRTLTVDRVDIFGNADGNGDAHAMPLVKVADFEFCRRHAILGADDCDVRQDVIKLPEKGQGHFLGTMGISADIYSVGRIFFAMIKDINDCKSYAGEICTKGSFSGACGLYENDGIVEEEYLEGLDTVLSLDGVDLLKQLLCREPNNRISVFEALQHRYFADLASSHFAVNRSPVNVQRLQMLHAMELNNKKHGECDVVRFEPSQAAAMVDWLFEIASVFHISTRTVFLAVGYYNSCCQQSIIDLILDKDIVGIKKYQLLAATCLHIASKYEDDSHVDVGNLSFSADRTFKIADIMALEHKVLNVIKWKLAMPTIYDFATCYLDGIGIQDDSQSFWLSLYICELALESTIHIEFQPSIIAASVLVLAQYSANAQALWTKETEMHSGYTWQDLSQCLLKLSAFLEARGAFQELSVIDRRYRKSSRMSVSTINIKTIKTSAQLEAMNPHL